VTPTTQTGPNVSRLSISCISQHYKTKFIAQRHHGLVISHSFSFHSPSQWSRVTPSHLAFLTGCRLIYGSDANGPQFCHRRLVPSSINNRTILPFTLGCCPSFVQAMSQFSLQALRLQCPSRFSKPKQNLLEGAHVRSGRKRSFLSGIPSAGQENEIGMSIVMLRYSYSLRRVDLTSHVVHTMPRIAQYTPLIAPLTTH
jgi:hypothetical protein